MNYFELYPGDYLRDTTRLTLLDHGVYLRMLMAYYSEEQPLPADDGELFVIVSALTTADRASVRKVADKFFPVGTDGLRRNARADREIAKAQKRIQTARENGAKNHPKNNPAGNPVGMPSGDPSASQRGTQPHTHSGEALHMPCTKQEQEQKSKALERQAARFDEFWLAYPNRKGRKDAMAKWKAKGLDRIADRIITDVKARIAGDKDWLAGYAPHGSTYVNGEGWEDAIIGPNGRGPSANEAFGVAR